MLHNNNDNHYFNVGLSAINLIALIMLETNKHSSNINNILDFGCGHGRIMRYFQSAFPQANIYGCDLEESQVTFCQSEFNAIPKRFDGNLKNLSFNKSFDLIWLVV